MRSRAACGRRPRPSTAARPAAALAGVKRPLTGPGSTPKSRKGCAVRGMSPRVQSRSRPGDASADVRAVSGPAVGDAVCDATPAVRSNTGNEPRLPRARRSRGLLLVACARDGTKDDSAPGSPSRPPLPPRLRPSHVSPERRASGGWRPLAGPPQGRHTQHTPTSCSRGVKVHAPVLEVTVHDCPSRAWATLTTFTQSHVVPAPQTANV